MDFYAYIETPNGEKIDVSEKIINKDTFDVYSALRIPDSYYQGKLYTNVYNIICYNNELSYIEAPNASFIDCENNLLERVFAPNCKKIFCEDNPLLEKEQMILHPDFEFKTEIKQLKR